MKSRIFEKKLDAGFRDSVDVNSPDQYWFDQLLILIHMIFFSEVEVITK
jgi:hypothetical protein